MTPIYDIAKTYLGNLAQGPFFTGEIPQFSPAANPVDFLGFKLNSPLGVPAGPLLDSKWIALSVKLGFDLPTHKTLRSFFYAGRPIPNIAFVKNLSKEKARHLEKENQSLQSGQAMLDAEAQIAMSATGMIWNPLLAIQYRERGRNAVS